MKVFEEGKDIYYHQQVRCLEFRLKKHGVNSELRQKGKIAELALGYGGSVGALKSYGST